MLTVSPRRASVPAPVVPYPRSSPPSSNCPPAPPEVRLARLRSPPAPPRQLPSGVRAAPLSTLSTLPWPRRMSPVPRRASEPPSSQADRSAGCALTPSWRRPLASTRTPSATSIRAARPALPTRRLSEPRCRLPSSRSPPWLTRSAFICTCGASRLRPAPSARFSACSRRMLSYAATCRPPSSRRRSASRRRTPSRSASTGASRVSEPPCTCEPITTWCRLPAPALSTLPVAVGR